MASVTDVNILVRNLQNIVDDTTADGRSGTAVIEVILRPNLVLVQVLAVPKDHGVQPVEDVARNDIRLNVVIHHMKRTCKTNTSSSINISMERREIQKEGTDVR